MTAKNLQSWQVLNFLFITIGLLKKEFKERNLQFTKAGTEKRRYSGLILIKKLASV
jgi:hypothetical protein